MLLNYLWFIAATLVSVICRPSEAEDFWMEVLYVP